MIVPWDSFFSFSHGPIEVSWLHLCIEAVITCLELDSFVTFSRVVGGGGEGGVLIAARAVLRLEKQWRNHTSCHRTEVRYAFSFSQRWVRTEGFFVVGVIQRRGVAGRNTLLSP